MPNRILKESICTSESLNQLSWFEQVFFDHLIVNCDDYGRMDARPAILKAKLFPLSGGITFGDIEKALESLVRVGCVCLYESGGKPYLYLPSWEKHQVKRTKNSNTRLLKGGGRDAKPDHKRQYQREQGPVRVLLLCAGPL